MNLLDSIILGSIQGATEFLPISSSGHLFLMEQFLDLEQNLSFEIALHFASLLAIIVFFHKEIRQLLVSFFQFCIGKKSETGAYALKILVATLITVPVALVVKKSVFDAEQLTQNLVAIMLIITGVMIIVAEKGNQWFTVQKNTEFLTWKNALLLGLVQGLTVVPGISRSGTTIALLVLLGLGRQFSVKTSFFLALPTIIGAMIFSLHDAGGSLPLGKIELVGCVLSFFVALLAIKWMLKLVEKNWIWFAPYCLGLGVLLFF